MAEIKIVSANRNDYPQLVAIWEQSVRMTHHFLSPADIAFYKRFMEASVLATLDVYCLKCNNEISGFLGMKGKSLEMLFISPTQIGKGLGKSLLHFAIKKGVNRVEVNEQNEAALEFYLRFGFQVESRQPIDGFGKPYPILSLKLVNSVLNSN